MHTPALLVWPSSANPCLRIWLGLISALASDGRQAGSKASVSLFEPSRACGCIGAGNRASYGQRLRLADAGTD